VRNVDETHGATQVPGGRHVLTTGTLIAAALAVCVGQIGLAIPAVLNGLLQSDLTTTSSQLTWISDAFLVPITLLELSFGVVGDLFGRKRLLVGGGVLMSLGLLIVFLTPGPGTAHDTRLLVFWVGQAIAGIGAAALFPTSLAMVAAGTHSARERARSISIWAASLSAGGLFSPVIGGLAARLKYGSDANAGWRWAFLAVCIIAGISALVSILLATDSSAPVGRSLDWPGQITIAVAMFALLFAVIQGPTSGWGSVYVVGGFLVAAVFLVLFVLAERRSTAPLLRLELFANRAFSVAAIATVFGMFSFLGTAYATSIRLTSIQGFTPLKAAVAFLLLQGAAIVIFPITHRVLERYNPKWPLGLGALLIAVGDFWIANISSSDFSIAPVIAPLAVIGIGFAFAVSAVTAVAVNTVPNRLTGMAAGSTSLLRDFGFTLGPAVIGAIALSRAATEIHSKIAASPALQSALAAFNAAPAHAPAAQQTALGAAVGAVNSGPLGANGVPATVPGANGKPMPFNPLHDVAFHALDHAYALGYVVCGSSALIAAALALLVLRGGSRDTQLTEESLAV
jgi:MFS family permease